jgi:apolipoprotein N-acyltransferase
MQRTFWKLGSLEVVGRGGSLRRPAGVAVSAGRADARLALDLRLVWAGSAAVGDSVASLCGGPRPLRRGFLLGYLCGVLWYMGNCYWVRDTMLRYGDMPPMAPTLLLIGYSLVLGLYFGLFGLGVVLVRRATGSTRLALAAAPILWAALELAAARITSVPGTSSATRRWTTPW